MGELIDWLIAHEDNFRKARLPSLYSDFSRQKATNPDGYAANVATWYSGICAAAAAGALPGDATTLSFALDGQLLQSLHSRKYGAPAAIGSVMEESCARAQMVPLHGFLSATESIYSRGWVLPTPSAVLQWALRTTGLGSIWGAGPSSPQTRYVLVANVEAMASRLKTYLAEPRGRLERLIPMETFRSEVAKALGQTKPLPEQDVKVLLTYLSRDKPSLVFNDSLVKISTTSASTAERAITAQDREITSIKALQEQLATHEEQLAARIAAATATARKHVAQHQSAAALRALRAKKRDEALLERRIASREPLDAALARIEEAVDQVALVRALEGSTTVLRQLNAATGGRAAVEHIVDQLQDEMDISTEIGTVMQGVGTGVDETEVDEELAALEAETVQAEAAKTDAALEAIPAVPTKLGTGAQTAKGETDRTLEADIEALQRLSVEDNAASTAEAMRTTTTTTSDLPPQREAAPAT